MIVIGTAILILMLYWTIRLELILHLIGTSK